MSPRPHVLLAPGHGAMRADDLRVEQTTADAAVVVLTGELRRFSGE